VLLQEKAGVAAVTQQVHLALSKDDKFDVFAFEEINGAHTCRRKTETDFCFTLRGGVAHRRKRDGGIPMALRIHEPEAEMGGGRVIRVSNKDRPMAWITFHFESEHDAVAAHKLLEDALNNAVKVEWP
jgi:hypothetical protein